MVHRAAYMIANGIPASQILIFTFTRKAAQELKDRVSNLLGSSSKGMWVSTYHSFCAHVLRKYAQHIGYTKSFSIYTETEKSGVLTKIKDDLGIKIEISKVAAKISEYKEKMLTPEQARTAESVTGNQEDIIFADIYTEYQKILKNCNALDFDDLIFWMIKLLETKEDIRREINGQYRYIIADEGHDSSVQDLRLISLLSGPDPKEWNLCFILDSDQSIYGFRGADISATIRFIKENKLTEISMGQNYRSTKTIVEASDKLIRTNMLRLEKEVFTKNDIGNPITLCTADNNFQEVRMVTDIVKDCIARGYSYNDIAILYRMNRQSYDYEKAFLKEDIPYRILRGLAFAKRREIQDIMAYVQLTINSNDREAFKRIINVPARFVGDKTISQVEDILNANPGMNVLEACGIVKLKLKKTKAGIQSFLYVMNDFQDIAAEIQNNEEITADKLIKAIVDVTNYRSFCESYSKDKKEYYERLGNILALTDIAKNYPTIEEFTEAVICTINPEEESEEGFVTLSTMHSSKGLEWPVVIIIGCNEGTTPCFMEILGGEIEESRRLFYVAMTRAKQELYLTRAKIVMTNGNWQVPKISRFIREIPQRFLKER